MNAQPLIPDNISEVLVKILQFTDLRRRVLHGNMRSIDVPGFTPQDLPVREFADVLNEALAEHLQSHRLLFRDTAAIQFGSHNAMHIQPQADAHASALLRSDRDEYMELQINKLMENALNRKVAEELLRQKCGAYPAVSAGDRNSMAMRDEPWHHLPTPHETTE
jgi:flagellar basal body rod protein FlgB